MIKFGTSGWRGLIAEDFTFKSLRLASSGVADYLISKGVKKGVIVGYDTRFMSERFAQEVVLVLASKGIHTFLTNRDVPTPVISAYIIKNKLDGGINITASHNTYQYSGFKFSPSWGGPALPEDTKAIESLINASTSEYAPIYNSIEEVEKKKLCSVIDPKKDYYDLIEKNVDLDGVSGSGIKIYYDAIYGTGRDYLDKICKKHDLDITTIKDYRDPYFGGATPEPSRENLKDLREMVSGTRGLVIGVSTDGDADRFGIIGSDGFFIEPNKVIALLADYLINTRKFNRNMGCARSFATGSLIDMVAKKYGLKLYENPVGFKYIGKLIANGKIIIGGEESAGLSIINHVPEKDGILASLLMIEAMGKRKASTTELLDDFYKRVGRLETSRENYEVSAELKGALSRKLAAVRNKFLGFDVEKIEKVDGTKIHFKNRSWLLFRESGTEPMVRVYGEAPNEGDLSEIMDRGKKFLFEE